MNKIQCEVCGKGMEEGATLYRVNETGVPGIWRCKPHLTFEQESSLDFDCKKIVEAIEEHNRNT